MPWQLTAALPSAHSPRSSTVVAPGLDIQCVMAEDLFSADNLVWAFRALQKDGGWAVAAAANAWVVIAWVGGATHAGVWVQGGVGYGRAGGLGRVCHVASPCWC